MRIAYLLFIALALQPLSALTPRESARMESTNRQLHRTTLSRGNQAFVGMGERLPAFMLIDQDAELFDSRELMGDYTVINFIFTRCTVPNMCPAATQRMVELQQLADAQGIEDLRIVSVSFDPAFDTPAVLTDYAQLKGANTTTNLSFLTGDKRTINNLMKLLGVLVYDDEELIYNHTMQTTLLGPSGRVIYRIPGSMWSAQDFLDQIAEHRNRKP